MKCAINWQRKRTFQRNKWNYNNRWNRRQTMSDSFLVGKFCSRFSILHISNNRSQIIFLLAPCDLSLPPPPVWGGVEKSGTHGRPHIAENGVSWPPWKNGRKIKKRKHAKKSSFLCLCYILRAIKAGRFRERQIHFTMHHFVVKFLKFSLSRVARGHWLP